MIDTLVLLAPLVGADVELFFRAGRQEAPVVIELVAPGDMAALDGVRRARDGRALGHERFVAARVSRAALARLSSSPRVARIHADGLPWTVPAPLAGTAAEIEAPDVWAQRHADLPLSGHGVSVCDIDSGIDVFHPMFFRADGGYHAWRDEDGDGRLTPGVDNVVVDGMRVMVRVLDAPIYGPFSNTPLFGSDGSELDAAFDWVYADLNDNGVRDFGRSAGFDDAAPAFGEPLFVVDDVDQNRRLDRDEKLVRLGTSKIRVVHSADGVFVRGQNLVDVPAVEAAHGTASASVLVGGNRGLGRITGVAPDAELVMVLRGPTVAELYSLTSLCLSEGARVVLHEYAPWQGFFLDGSSPLEGLIDTSSADGVAHIHPAGNLSGADKLYKRSHPPGGSTPIDIVVPDDADYRIVGITLLWREPGRELALALEDPTGLTRALPAQGTVDEPWQGGLDWFALRDVSPRGTARADAYLFDQDERATVPAGTWRVHVSDATGGAPFEMIAYVADDVSGWGKGVHFPAWISEDHLIGFPGTADDGIAVAAYAHHGYWGGAVGQRAWYSGRGRRIDGQPLLSVAAPDDPIAAGWLADRPASYRIFGGTSGASPHVAGAAALWLQANAGGDVRAALRSGALADAAVGEAPNDDYGWGKLRIHRSLFGADPPSGPPVLAVAARELAVGEVGVIDLVASDPDEGPLTAAIDRDYDGVYEEPLQGLSYAVRFDEPGRYVHKLRVTDASGREAVALARIDVHEHGELGPAGGCALAPRPPAESWWLVLSMVLTFGARPGSHACRRLFASTAKTTPDHRRPRQFARRVTAPTCDHQT